MKKTLFVSIALLACSVWACAQRFEDSKNINLSIGGLKNGTEVAFGYEKLKGKNAGMTLELSILTKKQELTTKKDIDVKLTSFLVDAGYRYYTYPLYNFYPYVSLGLFGGYELITNKTDIPNSVIMDRENSFVYGLTPKIGVEYNLEKISFELYIKPRYELKYSEFVTSCGLSAKYYF